MPCSDLDRVPDSKAGHVPFGLEIPQRLVGLAELGKAQVKRLARIIDNGVPRDPGINRPTRMTHARSDLALLIIDPKAIGRMMRPRFGGQRDDASDQSSGS